MGCLDGTRTAAAAVLATATKAETQGFFTPNNGENDGKMMDKSWKNHGENDGK
jgi:hypothetical protein